MYIIPEFRFCFLAEPRTGSKAVAKALTDRYGAVLVGSHHSTPDEHPEYEMNRDWVICSGVRNNWDTMISWWFKIERRGTMRPLNEFMPEFCENNPNFVHNHQLWWRTTSFINKLLRFETLNSDLDHALVTVGLPPLDLPVVTDSKRGGEPYQIFYKDDTSTWVSQYFADEIEKYQQKF